MRSGPPGLLVAGTRSGCGKTTVTLALLAAARRRGLKAQAAKAGPDFLDPTHHAAFTGRPSFNLDAWMGGEDGLRRSFARLLRRKPSPDLVLVEGVMGLFDGAQGVGGPGSAAHLARCLGLPVLLVTDVSGMGQSAAVLARGFADRLGAPLAGVVCTHVGGPGHEALLREAFAALDLPLAGLLPRQGAPDLKSRHLGLLPAEERAWNAADRDALGRWLEAHVDVDALLRRLPPLKVPDAPEQADPPPFARLGVARDAAFSFLYADFEDLARSLGLEPVFFSPLRDRRLPRCDALYFPGGYPELHAEALEANADLRRAVRDFARRRVVYGECGGYMYLMEGLERAGRSFAMTGLLPLRCRMGERLAALGYREVSPAVPGPFGTSAAGGRGHEYHYARLLPTNGVVPPLWRPRDRLGRPLPPEGALLGRTAGSWIHLYPQGSRVLWEHLARTVRDTQQEQP